MRKVCVEGWLGINHSYAMVNQWQLLKLIRKPIELKHKRLPFYNKSWSVVGNSDGLTDADKLAISNIPEPEDGESFDVVYRISFPYDLTNCNSDLFVFGTSEFQITKGMFANSDTSQFIKESNCRIVTPSNWSKSGFIKSGFSDQRVVVIPHGVDPLTFYSPNKDQRTRTREAIGIKQDDFVLLSLGAMTSNKGVDVTLLAYAMLKKKHKNIKLILKDQSNLYGIKGAEVVGNVMSGQYGNLFTEDVLADIVVISSNLSMAQLQGLYSAADCFISSYRAEGFNLPPLEAAACGTPIVVTKGGATDDYFSDEIGCQIESNLVHLDDGRVYLEPNLESLINSIEALMARPVANEEISKYVAANFSWGAAADKLYSLFSTGRVV